MKRQESALINRRNYRDTRVHLTYCLEVLQNNPKTVAVVRVAMDHLLQWASRFPLSRAMELRPTFPQYLEAGGISVVYRDKLLSYCRRFFVYSQRQWPDRYKVLRHDWIESLRAKGQLGIVEDREIYTVEQVRAITSLTPANLTEERDIAAVAFLFLSGMRVGAFTTLPLRAVDWSQSPALVRQWPKWGVQTKYRKAANTFLLVHRDLTDFHQLAEAWHQKALAAVGERGMWYTLLTPLQEFDPIQVPGDSRGNGFGRRLKSLCEQAGVPPYSPHKLRHGHIVWALQQCRKVEELKAVSQNVMHESLQTTDRIYGRLRDSNVATRIAALGDHAGSDEELIKAVVEALSRLKIGALG